MNRRSPDILVDQLTETRTAAGDLLWIVGFSLLTAVFAQIRIPLSFTPVPITGQTFAVLLSGAVLGCRRGFLSQALYLAEGAAGLPVFTHGAATIAHLLGPTGGYLWSYPVAAGLLGWLVERGAARKALLLAGALVVADMFILVAGAGWLGVLFRFPYSQAWVLGFYPFLIGDILKVALVGLTLPPILKRLDRRSGAPSREAGHTGNNDDSPAAQ